MKMSKRTKTILISISAPLLFIIAFAIVIGIYLVSHKPPEVQVMTTGFVPQTIEIPEGETIRFINPSSTITQTLCLGMNQHCDPNQLLPRGIASPGVRIPPDQSKDVVFDTYGTFVITSTSVPGINLTVTVDAAD
jgi:plastocyanin